MSAITASAVTLHRAWTEGGTAGKTIKCRQVSIVLSSQGGTAGDIPASVFGLTQFTEISPMMLSTDTSILIGVPITAGTSFLTMNFNAISGYFEPVNASGTFKCVVKGW